MQKSNLRRLSIPHQALSRQPSGLSRSQPDGYSQHLTPHSAPHGYHPQTIWVPDYRPPPGGPRAVPMRMQRLTMNQTDTRPMPIPSVQLASDRPYSVPNFNSTRRLRGSDDGLARPLRPASTSEVDEIDKLVPRRQLPFLNRSTSQRVEDDSHISHGNDLEDLEDRSRVLNPTRRVAKRGSKISTTNDSTRASDLSGHDLASEQDLDHPTGSQKRGNGEAADETYPSKKIKINVIRSQSQTPTALGTTNQKYPNTRSRESQLSRNSYEKDIPNQKKMGQNIEVDDDETQSSSGDDEDAETGLTSQRSGPTGTGRPDPYDIMDSAPSFEMSQDTGVFRKKRGTASNEEPDVPRSIVSSSSAIRRELSTNVQDTQYSNASSQCDIPSTSQVKPECKVPDQQQQQHQTTAVIGSAPGSQDARDRKPNEETLDVRLSRIEKAIRVQEGEGIDEFIKAKLSTGDPGILGTLTNEILLAMVVPNDELLEQVIKVM
ncbi:hypothetical protein F5B19DRAFT_466084 [Rostrohypoxylon terebratum]|nr:hypothetical protein F5B19DRAFT_466084 [Rostrohypoxylon terebratum]